MQAYAEGTHNNLKIQWETYLMFCIYFGLTYLPMDTSTLSLYAQFLGRSFKSTQSIKNYLSGVKTMHHLLPTYYLFTMHTYLFMYIASSLSHGGGDASCAQNHST